jgi:membrane protease YdiL (CAAX protease family)
MPEKFSKLRYFVAIIIFPLSLLVLYTIPHKLGIPLETEEGLSTWQNAVIAIVVSLLLLFICLRLSGEKLKSDWKPWRAHIIRNLFIACGCAVLMFVILSPIAKFISSLFSTTPPVANVLSVPLGLLNIGLLITSLTAPFTEEIIFRHYLVEPFARKKWTYAIAVLLSSIGFALVHIYNTGFDVRYLVMYFVMALFFSAVHIIAQHNIWQTIMTHLFYNGFIVIIGIIGVVTIMME